MSKMAEIERLSNRIILVDGDDDSVTSWHFSIIAMILTGCDLIVVKLVSWLVIPDFHLLGRSNELSSGIHQKVFLKSLVLLYLTE